MYLVNYLINDVGYQCWASPDNYVASLYDITGSYTNVSNNWKSLYIIGITSILIQFASYCIVFLEESLIRVGNAANLGGLLIQFFWLIAATVFRFKHTG